MRSNTWLASLRLIPCTLARSSIDACRIPCKPPNAFNRSVRRFGPSPGISSSGDLRRVLSRDRRCPEIAKR